MITGLLCLCVAGSLAATDVVEIPLKNRRPSRMMQTLLAGGEGPGFLPKGVTVAADDARRVIVADGPATGIQELRDIIQRFDIVPASVTIRIEVDSDFDAEDYSVTAMFSNNSSFTMFERNIGEMITVTARINKDSTITSTINVGRGGPRAFSITARTKVGTPIIIGSASRGLSKIKGAVIFKKENIPPDFPVLTVTVLDIGNKSAKS